MTTATAWWKTPEFGRFVPFIEMTWPRDKRAGTRPVFDLRSSAPWNVKADALQYTAPCARCGRAIHPFRDRTHDVPRSKKPYHIYLAVTCPLNVNMGCSRGGHATAAYDAIEELIEASNSQGGLL